MKAESTGKLLGRSQSSSLFSGSIPTFFGLALPLVLGAFSVPYIIEKLGVERFGVLTLIWAVVGYFSLFDFGISRALTKRVAELTDPAEAERLGRAIKGGLALLLGLGAFAALLTVFVYGLALKADYLQEGREAFLSMLYLTLSMPFLLVGLGLRGVLEGLQRFGPPNWSRVLLGVVTFGAPIPLLSYSPSLDVLVAALALGRVLTVLLQGWACRKELRLAVLAPADRKELVALLRFGGWMTVSNLISPIMVFIDRFVVGASPHASSLAYYTAPFEVVTRLLIVPGAITTALFPKLSAMHRQGDVSAGDAILVGMCVTLAIVAPGVMLLQLFASDILHIWIGAEFAQYGALPLQLIAWGVLFNALAHFPFAYLQSVGRPDWIAKLHVVELPIYLVLMVLMLEQWGIVGVAVAWLLRALIDCVLLCGLVLKMSGNRQLVPMLTTLSIALVSGGGWFWLAEMNFVDRIFIFVAIAVLFIWRLLLVVAAQRTRESGAA